MDVKETVIEVLNDLIGEDFSTSLDTNLFESELLDSMATVQLLLELQEKLDIEVPVSEFDRAQWDTPNKIIEQVKELQHK